MFVLTAEQLFKHRAWGSFLFSSDLGEQGEEPWLELPPSQKGVSERELQKANCRRNRPFSPSPGWPPKAGLAQEAGLPPRVY